MLLSKKNAIITGSSSGIGAAVLELFAQNGANIFCCARTPSDLFIERIDFLSNKYGVTLIPIFFDFGEESGVKKAIKEIIDKKINIDILVNNAGIASGSTFHMTTRSEIENQFDVNFFSQIQFTQSISRLMMRNHGGSIVNISSISGIDAGAGTIAYGASKAALIFATKVMARELGRFNIKVNSVAPGITDTKMYKKMDQKQAQKVIENNCLMRIAQPEEIAKSVLFFASDLSSYVTGQTLRVDGGYF
jgi:3-oxoacyl-[acyl-carrier protein] reductase